MRIFNIKVIKALAPLNKAILAIIIEDFPGNCGHHRRSWYILVYLIPVSKLRRA